MTSQPDRATQLKTTLELTQNGGVQQPYRNTDTDVRRQTNFC